MASFTRTNRISSDESSEFFDSCDSDDLESVDLNEDIFEERIIVAGAVVGYQFEPENEAAQSGSESDASSSTSDSSEENAILAKWKERMHTTSWCDCGKKCVNSNIPEENACCREKAPVNTTIDEYNADFETITCITEHPAFRTHCLDVWSLQLAYRLYHKKEIPGAVNMKYRYIAYRQLVRWCWRYLGIGNRVPLPACCVHIIRETFPPEGEIVGFKYPPLKLNK